LGQENAPNPAKTFFYFYFGGRLFSGAKKKTLQFQRRSLFRVPDFGALGLALLSKNTSCATVSIVSFSD